MRALIQRQRRGCMFSNDVAPLALRIQELGDKARYGGNIR